MRTLKLSWLWVLLLLLLSGCWDKTELEDQAYVVVLGIDKARGNLVNITFQIANPQVGSSTRAEAPKEPPSDTITVAAPDIISAKELANSIVSRKLNFGHLRTMIIGENFARSDNFQNIIGTSLRDPEMRREINLIVSQEEARFFIRRNKPKMETRPHKYFTFMQQRWRDTGEVPYSTLNRYFQRVSGALYLSIYATTNKAGETQKNDEDDYIAGEIPQIGGDPVQMIGSAVFKSGRMIGKLTGEETRYSLLLRRKALAKTLVTSFPDPLDNKYRVSLRLIRRTTPKIDINVATDTPVVNAKIPIVAQVLAIPSLIDYAQDINNQQLLKESIQKSMETAAKQLVQKSQKQFKAEPFIWYVEARRKFSTISAFQAYNWEKKFENAEVNIQFDIKMEMFGKQLEPPEPKQESRGG